ncbi:two-component system response regulator [Clostridium sp.]|uniref:response regulator n=1 Tax=Clostridium sp. TaxID=1506 RepID=UPI003217C8DB
MLGSETILIVDDTPDNLILISEVLKDDYKIKVANRGERALKIANSDPQPDLILLDIMMPEMDGFEVCKKLKENPHTSKIPVIYLTAKTQVEDEQLGLNLGAVDYITKPISVPIMKARIRNHLQLKAASDFLKSKSDFLENEVRKRTQEIRDFQDVTIFALTALAETRDMETGYHIRRTQLYVKILAEKLKTHIKFSDRLTDRYIDLLYRSAPLHDIGKVGIPDAILLKPDRLTEEEFKVMKEHAAIGMRALEDAEKLIGYEVGFLKCAKEISLFHHEKWDGTGYPTGVSGYQIPVSARLMAIADVYDALTSKRRYRKSISHEEAVESIKNERGAHFDPDIVDIFLEIQNEFKNIMNLYSNDKL